MRIHRAALWSSLLALVAVALAIVLVPVFLIRPFIPQTPASISAAYRLRHWSPVITVVTLAVGLVLVWRFWPRLPRRVSKIAAVALLAPLLLAAWLSRQNHFEWMFAPIRDPRFVRAGSAGFVRTADMVLAVTIRGDAVAYPVPLLAYHHLVNDEVGGVPIVATY